MKDFLKKSQACLYFIVEDFHIIIRLLDLII